MAPCTCRRPPDTANSKNSAIVSAESCARPTYTQAVIAEIRIKRPDRRRLDVRIQARSNRFRT
jgi:hypothetical protein